MSVRQATTQTASWFSNAERVLVGYLVLFLGTEAPGIIDGGVDSLGWKEGAIVIAYILLGMFTRAGVWSKRSVAANFGDDG